MTYFHIYAADADSVFHGRCYELLDKWGNEASAWYVTWGILYEFLRVTTHPRVFRRPWSASEAWGFIEALATSPFLGILTATERNTQVVARVIRELPHLSGNLMQDLQTAALMRKRGVRRIYTRDTDFHRFPFVEPIDPVA